MKSLVSIIMVVYNSSEFLREAIESVLESEYENLELLITDDNSTDDSWNIIKSYKDKRIKAQRNKINIGEYNNRNKTIRRASGEFFVFVDGDDTLLSTGLKDAVTFMQQFPESAFGIVRPENENITEPLELTPIETYRRHYLEKSPINLSFARNIFRTEIIKTHDYYLPLNVISGDDYIRMQLSSIYKILLLPKPFAKWRYREGQASQTKTKKVKGILEPFILKHYFLCSPQCPLSYREKYSALIIINKKIFAQAINLVKYKNYKHAFILLRKLPYFWRLKTFFTPLNSS